MPFSRIIKDLTSRTYLTSSSFDWVLLSFSHAVVWPKTWFDGLLVVASGALPWRSLRCISFLCVVILHVEEGLLFDLPWRTLPVMSAESIAQ